MKLLGSRRGEMMLSVCAVLMAAMYVFAMALRVYPVFLHKQQLDDYASQLCRIAEVAGRIGTETEEKEDHLNQITKISPDISWNTSGNVQLGGTITVTCSLTENVGLFGGFGSFPVTIRGHATGQSEVYWK